MSPQLESLTLIDMLDLDDTFIVNPTVRWFKIFDSLIFQNSCALVSSKLMEVEIGLKYVRATNRSLETDRYKSLIDELFICFRLRTLLVTVNSNAQKYNNFLHVSCNVMTSFFTSIIFYFQFSFSNFPMF